MGEKTGISWTDHTLNPWIGCTRVSPGCEHCYAEGLATTRMKLTWGPEGDRRETKHWMRDLFKWNRAAERDGVRRKVFIASLADVFEINANPEVNKHLNRIRGLLFPAIEACTALDMLLLTKRPENVLELVPDAWRNAFPAHVWQGATMEDGAYFRKRMKILEIIPSRVRWCSWEPSLGPIHGAMMDMLPLRLDWIIAGCESGAGARPMEEGWARAALAISRNAGIKFFMKQMVVDGRLCKDPEMFPREFQVQEFPS